MPKQIITGRRILADLADALGLPMPVTRIALDVSIDGVPTATEEIAS